MPKSETLANVFDGEIRYPCAVTSVGEAFEEKRQRHQTANAHSQKSLAEFAEYLENQQARRREEIRERLAL